MWELIVFVAFGEPGEHQRWTHERVAAFASYEQCDRARWEWWRADRLPQGYAPHFTKDTPGWFQNGVPACEQGALTS